MVAEESAGSPVLRGRKIYERHLDLLLAEELSCNLPFARFVCGMALGDRVPVGDPLRVHVVVSNFGDVGVDVGAAGEDDLLVEAHWATGEVVRVLVEDKLDAVLQREQMGRYAARAVKHGEVEGVVAAAALLVAPEEYIKGRRSEFGAVQTLSIEQIAKWLELAADDGASVDVAARLRWRAQHLVIFDEGRSLPAPELPAMIEARERIVDRLTQLSSRAQPGAGMRTAGSGWLPFTYPKALTYKVVHGTVDIYLADLWPDDPARVESVHSSGHGPAGFVAERDGSGNPVLRSTVRAAGVTARIRPIVQVDADELARGADACDAATQWVAAQ